MTREPLPDNPVTSKCCIDLRDPRLGPLGKDYMATVRHAMQNIHGVYPPLPPDWPEKKKI